MNPTLALQRFKRSRAIRVFPFLILAGALTMAAPAAAAPGAAHGPAHPPSDPAPRGDTLTHRIDPDRLLDDLRILAHDSMEGRRAGTPGAERARRFLLPELEVRGLQPLEAGWTHEFTIRPSPRAGPTDGPRGVNLLGVVPGTEHPERYVVVTAHYDHLGIVDGEIFNGADDNASGTAALLSLAGHFAAHPPRHSFLFVAFDAEELGLRGARAFVSDPPVPLERIIMNVNLDMVSRSEAGELYAAGTHHYPFLVPLVEEAAREARVTLLMGHDTPDLPPGDDWTLASDHGPFHQEGIPFIYFGVEDHPGYHHPSDTFEDITPGFFAGAVETVLDFLLILDREGEEILR